MWIMLELINKTGYKLKKNVMLWIKCLRGVPNIFLYADKILNIHVYNIYNMYKCRYSPSRSVKSLL